MTRPETLEQLEQYAARMAKLGQGMTTAARAIGLSREKLRTIAKAAGIKFPGGNYTPDAIRSRAAWIERHRKLTDEQIRAIRADTRPQRVVALELGVHQSTVRRIRLGEAWKNID